MSSIEQVVRIRKGETGVRGLKNKLKCVFKCYKNYLTYDFNQIIKIFFMITTCPKKTLVFISLNFTLGIKCTHHQYISHFAR